MPGADGNIPGIIDWTVEKLLSNPIEFSDCILKLYVSPGLK
jgi:hypothetical protein